MEISLTRRENEVLEILSTGATNREIAEKLIISIGTVKAHIHNISKKLCAEGRHHLLVKARQIGLID
ncbi:MAG: response regulator transcription factor [Anaerolineaceae bacterium]|nr:response regulator transcription factor [Anaerolineaceae bacterium]